MELLDATGAAPKVLPRHRLASPLWLVPLAALVAVFVSVKGATTRQSQRFAAPSQSAIADNRGYGAAFQRTSREAPFQFKQSTFTSASSDSGLGSNSSGSQSDQADQFAGDIEILFREEAPSVGTARGLSALADRSMARSALRSDVAEPYPLVRVDKPAYATNRVQPTRSTISLNQPVVTKWRKIARATAAEPNEVVRSDPADKLSQLPTAAIAEKSTNAAERSVVLPTASYVEAKVDAYRPGNSGFGANSRKTEERKPGTFGEAASSAVAPSDAAASKPITIASTGHLTTWVLTSGGVINRSKDGVSWQPLSSGTDRDLIAGTAPSAEVCWVVGRAGTILRTTDGEQWERIRSPAGADLLSIAATDEYSAIVQTADGRRFATENGGKTWRLTRN